MSSDWKQIAFPLEVRFSLPKAIWNILLCIAIHSSFKTFSNFGIFLRHAK
jgi:hypothetical protein